MNVQWVRRPRHRRVVLGLAALISAFLAVWPRPYAARAQLMPNQSGGGLASLLGASGSGGSALASLGALVGGKNSIESDLTIARSLDVAQDAARRMPSPTHRSAAEIDREGAALRHKVDVEIVRGGIMQLSAIDHDPQVAKNIVTGYVDAVRDRLGSLDYKESSQQKAIAEERMGNAATDLARAQAALDQFRLANRLAVPEVQLGAEVSLIAQLQAKLQAEQSQLALQSRFYTDNSVQVQAAQAEIEATTRQLAQAQANQQAQDAPTLGNMAPKISEYETLYRNEKFAEAEYDIYRRYMETLAVQMISSPFTMTIVQSPFIDPDRQYNLHFVGLFVLIVMFGVLAEFYIARPPPGALRGRAHEVG